MPFAACVLFNKRLTSSAAPVYNISFVRAMSIMFFGCCFRVCVLLRACRPQDLAPPVPVVKRGIDLMNDPIYNKVRCTVRRRDSTTLKPVFEPKTEMGSTATTRDNLHVFNGLTITCDRE